MRTTLNIDDDLLRIAKSLAATKALSLSEIISQLIRKGLEKKLEYRTENNFPVFTVSENARIITLEDVKKLEDEE